MEPVPEVGRMGAANQSQGGGASYQGANQSQGGGASYQGANQGGKVPLRAVNRSKSMQRQKPNKSILFICDMHS